MKKYVLFLVLIVVSTFAIGGCNKNNATISGTTMDFRIEVNADNSLVETITIDFDTKNYSGPDQLNEDRRTILGYLEEDTKQYLHTFKTIVEQDTVLPIEVKEEYKETGVITYEPKLIVNDYMIMFVMTYKNSAIRQMWYHFVKTSKVLDYHDEIFMEESAESTTPVINESGTWFNKSYIKTDSVYEYAFVPYPTFTENFVYERTNITYTQTLITSYDDLKTNAIKETLYDGNVVERTWIIDVNKALSANANDSQLIEYYILRANRVNWYILALAISVMFVIFLFIVALVKFINKRRSNLN